MKHKLVINFKDILQQVSASNAIVFLQEVVHEKGAIAKIINKLSNVETIEHILPGGVGLSEIRENYFAIGSINFGGESIIKETRVVIITVSEIESGLYEYLCQKNGINGQAFIRPLDPPRAANPNDPYGEEVWEKKVMNFKKWLEN